MKVRDFIKNTTFMGVAFEVCEYREDGCGERLRVIDVLDRQIKRFVIERDLVKILC